jgi:hypothetical protein
MSEADDCLILQQFKIQSAELTPIKETTSTIEKDTPHTDI